jgi:hypothetical protein
MNRQFLVGLACFGAVGMLTACSQSTLAGWQTVAQAWRAPAAPDLAEVPLHPALRYLRVRVGSKVGLMVQAGGVDGPWYGADGVVLRLREGRLVGFADARRSWTEVRHSGWPDLQAPTPDDQPPRQGHLVADLQPGHRYGLRQSHAWAHLPDAPPGHDWLGDTTGLRWMVARPDEPGATATATWHAIDMQRQPAAVVYGRQCLHLDPDPTTDPTCITWQRWPR